MDRLRSRTGCWSCADTPVALLGRPPGLSQREQHRLESEQWGCGEVEVEAETGSRILVERPMMDDFAGFSPYLDIPVIIICCY